MKECLALLQSTKPPRPLSFTPSSFVVYSFIGTATDYLIKYAADGNRLFFENTVDHIYDSETRFGSKFSFEEKIYDQMSLYESSHQDSGRCLENLYEIGKQLDGRNATDYQAVYRATSLILLFRVFHTKRLPNLFTEPISKDKKAQIKKTQGKDIQEKTTKFLFDEYYESLGGDQYAQDVSESIKTFVSAIGNQESEIFNAQFIPFGRGLSNAVSVGGADFDCLIQYNNRLILTDIKTITEPLKTQYLRQILGYALLYDSERDEFDFTSIGIYHSRSGSFRFLPINDVIEKALPGFKSVSQAREEFINAVRIGILGDAR